TDFVGDGCLSLFEAVFLQPFGQLSVAHIGPRQFGLQKPLGPVFPGGRFRHVTPRKSDFHIIYDIFLLTMILYAVGSYHIRYGLIAVPQHFLLSKAARSLSLAQVFRLSDVEAEDMFKRVRWADTDGAPVCPACGGLDAYDCRR